MCMVKASKAWLIWGYFHGEDSAIFWYNTVISSWEWPRHRSIVAPFHWLKTILPIFRTSEKKERNGQALQDSLALGG